MLVTMQKHVFDMLDHAALVRACLEPTILKIRGKDETVKTEAYAELNSGQQALFMFQVLYGHAHTVAELYWFANYYIAEFKAWPKIKDASRFFGDDAMLQLYEELEGILEAKNRQANGEWRRFSAHDLDEDPELLASISRLHTSYHQLAPETLQRISAYIRANAEEFVHFAN